MPDLSGQTFGRYHLLEKLGEGGMATVYKAYDTRLERDVAVKIIRRGAFPADSLERMLKRFEREAKALARLSHPNIVKIHDYGEFEGTPYLVMEYLPGGTLKQRLGTPMPWQEAARLLLPIARALEYAHSQGMIHRDVKPSNILITQSGDPMLTDFGIAKILEGDDSQTLTGTGVGVGTPEYMAPEQWTGKAGTQADTYSLGVVFYELVTGRKPYTADTPAAILLKQASEPLPRPGYYISGLPEPLEKILLKALAKDPGDRYEHIAGMAAALESLLAGSPLPPPPVHAVERPVENKPPERLPGLDDSMGTIDQFALPSETQQPGAAKPAPVPARKRLRWLWGVVIVGILFLIVGGVGLAYYFGLFPASPAQATSTPDRLLTSVAGTVASGASPTRPPIIVGTALPCNVAGYDVSTIDVTVPDNTVMAPGQEFVKTWRLRNDGSCNWTSGYSLVFISGDPLGVPDGYTQPLNVDLVAPGQAVEVSVTLLAPTEPGMYNGRWRLADEAGNTFEGGFYVQIVVMAPTP